MPIDVTAEEEILVGRASVVEGHAPDGPLSAILEDHEDTGYFYALDNSAKENQIQDALHIYNVENVTDKRRPSLLNRGELR